MRSWIWIALLLASCGKPSAPPAAPTTPEPDGTFRYDPETGRCLDAAGNEGFNARSVEEVLESRDGECVDLHGIQMMDLPMELPSATGVRFAGADLRDVGFRPYAAPRGDTDLRGADIRGARDVYGMPLEGRIDAFTKYGDNCTILDEHEAGVTRISCEKAE